MMTSRRSLYGRGQYPVDEFFVITSRRRHTRLTCDWSSDVCSSDLMAMYHSWDSQNAWLRQIHTHNYLFVNPKTAATQRIADGDWVWVESPWGKVRGMCRYSEATEPGTVWTWNAIGKQPGAWNLEPRANEARQGFLLNHLISEELPPLPEGEHLSNSDPVTGQAGWYDVRVRIYKAVPAEEKA